MLTLPEDNESRRVARRQNALVIVPTDVKNCRRVSHQFVYDRLVLLCDVVDVNGHIFASTYNACSVPVRGNERTKVSLNLSFVLIVEDSLQSE